MHHLRGDRDFYRTGNDVQRGAQLQDAVRLVVLVFVLLEKQVDQKTGIQ